MSGVRDYRYGVASRRWTAVAVKQKQKPTDKIPFWSRIDHALNSFMLVNFLTHFPCLFTWRGEMLAKINRREKSTTHLSKFRLKLVVAYCRPHPHPNRPIYLIHAINLQVTYSLITVLSRTFFISLSLYPLPVRLFSNVPTRLKITSR